MKKNFRLSLTGKKIILLLMDLCLIQLVYLTAFAIRSEFSLEHTVVREYWPIYQEHLIWIAAVKILIFYLLGLYHSLWRYASTEELLKIAFTAVMANAAVMGYLTLAQTMLPRSIHALAVLLDMALLGGLRFSYRLLRNYLDAGIWSFGSAAAAARKILVVGAGEAGAMVIKELKTQGYRYGRPVGIIDDDPSKQSRRMLGVPVLGGREYLVEAVQKKKVDEIIMAIPSLDRKEMKVFLEMASETGVHLKTIPGIYELLDGKVSLKEIRDVEIEDLLGRDSINLNVEGISGYLKGRRVLVTGGGGSIGSELCRQIAAFQPASLMMLDIYENNLYEVELEIKKGFPELSVEALIGSVRDEALTEKIFQKRQPEVVFHAAAHKHVPLMEDSPAEAIKNNVMGTYLTALAAHRNGCRKFVLISTDKAVNPTNIMGASKRLAEMAVQSINEISRTEFASVRFGNVLGSSGSVVPLFRGQIASGGPVTVTHEEMTRYFMTIPEAVQLVIEAGALAKGGEVFVLDMGKPVKIMDLAENLIRLSGLKPHKDIETHITGLRPGEKLYEELLLDGENTQPTCHQKIFVEKPPVEDFQTLTTKLETLTRHINTMTPAEVKQSVAALVTTYRIESTNRNTGGK